MYALNARTGSLKWIYNTTHNAYPATYPAVSGNVVYVANGKLFGLDSKTGSLEWEYPLNEFMESSPVISEGMMYVTSMKVGGEESYLYAFSQPHGGGTKERAIGFEAVNYAKIGLL